MPRPYKLEDDGMVLEQVRLGVPSEGDMPQQVLVRIVLVAPGTVSHLLGTTAVYDCFNI